MAEDETDKTMIRMVVDPSLGEEQSEPCGHVALVVFAGHDIGKTYQLDGGEVILGRSQSAHLRIDEDGVSRRHACVTSVGGRTFIEDLKSTNGTTVNDQTIAKTELRDGDYIKIGDTVFKFMAASSIEASFHDDMYRRTTVDSLTQAFNKRYLLQKLAEEINRAKRYGRRLSLIMFDIDFFKKVNDTYGHQAGDVVLKRLAALTKENLRTNDVFARYGGEEFAIILPESSLDDALKVSEKIRAHMDETEFTHSGQVIPVTVSLGVKEYTSDMHDCDTNQFIEAADANLYKAKQAGRNRVFG